MVTRSFFSLIAWIMAIVPGLGQNYSASGLNTELTKNANAVFRLFEMNYTVKDTGKSVLKCHYVITILNKNGDSFAEFEQYYDKFSEISGLSGKLYNSAGVMIKKLKASDFSDVSAVSNSSIYDDNRLIYLKPLVSTYPYSAEFEFTQTYDGFINLPPWNPQPYYDLAVEKAIYRLTVPKDFQTRYKPINEVKTPVMTEDGLTRTYLLESENLPAVESEILSPGIQDMVSIGIFIPEYFKIGGVSCKNDSWKNLGYFFHKLNQLPNQLSEKTRSELAEIKTKAKSQKELVKLVYEYMQSKTRYVSIQMGLGGLQPFDASVVDKYGYGDCKALTNYTKTLLKEVDVRSYYTLVKARKYSLNILADESFDQFNHAILCVPFEKDTVWLECTSQTIPFGFLGSFTDNRNVLLITDEGGVLTKTITYKQDHNCQIRSGEFKLMPDGKAQGKFSTQYTGLQYDDNVGILYATPENQKEHLYQMVNLPTFVIDNYRLTEERSEIPSMNLELAITATKYAVTMGNRLLLPLNMLNRRQPLPTLNKERKSKMWIRYAYVDSDTITYHLPEGYVAESVPQKVELKSEFGVYTNETVYDAEQKTLKYVRVIRMNDGFYPPEKFRDYADFIKSISMSDNVKVSLLQKG